MKKKQLIFFVLIFFCNSIFAMKTKDESRFKNGLYSFPQLYEQTIKSTILIRCYYDSKLDNNYSSISRFFYGDILEERCTGSGFVYTKDGYILTNFHVIEECNKFEVQFFDDSVFPAELIGYDKRTDISLLKIDVDDLQPLILDEEEIKIGQWVYTIGNSVGLQNSLSVGIVGGKHRAENYCMIEDFIQLDINTNQGNSGAPILNLNGRVIGMDTWGFCSEYATGITFIIPNRILKKIAEQLIKCKNEKIKEGFFGFAKVIETSDGLFKIIDIVDNSPIEKAGLKKDDEIIEYNGIKITSLTDFFNYVSLLAPGEFLKLTICRNNVYYDVNVQKQEIAS